MSELDIEKPEQLLDYLRSSGRIGAAETPVFQVLAGGVSNRTVLVERAGASSWVIKQALGKLRVKVDWTSDPRRVHQEAKGLRWLERLAPPGTITPLIFEDHQHHLLAMAAVPRPHDNWKTLLLGGDVRRDHVEQFATLLASIHRAGWQQREVLSREFADRQFFDSLRLEPYYLYAAQQVPQALTFMRSLVAETRFRRLSIVHGDYSPKNILIHADRLILLDHEVIHFGDPAFDVGFSMTHLLSKAHHLPPHRQAFMEAARLHWETYLTRLGDVSWRDDLERHAVHHTLGCLLARVAGRSPLEYLTELERRRQRDLAVSLMPSPPATFAELMSLFAGALLD